MLRRTVLEDHLLPLADGHGEHCEHSDQLITAITSGLPHPPCPTTGSHPYRHNPSFSQVTPAFLSRAWKGPGESGSPKGQSIGRRRAQAAHCPHLNERSLKRHADCPQTPRRSSVWAGAAGTPCWCQSGVARDDL